MNENIRNMRVDAANIRIGILDALELIKAGHIGGSMSMADLMAVLYGGVMQVDAKDPTNENRDWLVVSKGHCGPAVYATLALHGFFPYEELKTVNQGGTRLPSHCDKNKTPGIDMTTGSLGQGMSTAIGVAWANQYHKKENYTYLVLGDGEIQEGQVWEGALFAAQQNLAHLIGFVDCNQKQLDGYTSDICDLGDIVQKFKDFGWDAISCDGNDIESLLAAIQLVKRCKDKPHMIVMHTTKGKGCSFAQDVFYNHHISFNEEQKAEAVALLQQEIKQLQEEI